MVVFFNAVNKIFSLFFALSLLFTSGINSHFNGDVYKWDSETGVVGAEALVRSQGVTNDGEFFYFSGKNALEKVSSDLKTVIEINTCAIPRELKEKYNSKHIGGISYADGYIYAPLEDSKEWQHPVIALYDKDTLKYTGKCFELPLSLHKRGVPFVIADSRNGVAYTGDSRNYGEIYVFDLDTFEHIKTLKLSQGIEKIQGGEYYNGFLYVGTNDSTRAVYKINTATGEAEKLFDRIAYQYKYINNFGGEGEDLTVIPEAEGLRIYTLQLGATFTDATLRCYFE